MKAEVNSWPLTSMQLSMVFQTMHGRIPGNYIQQLVCQSDFDINDAELRMALASIAERHPALRLQFELGHNAAQTVAESVTIPLETRLWEGVEKWEKFLHEDRVRSFDLSRAPLFRVTLFQGSPHRTCFVLTYHHALLDGRSRVKVMGELFQLLQQKQFSSNFLPPPPLPFTRYLSWMASKDHSDSKQFWSEYLKGLPAATDLPLPQSEEPGAAIGVQRAIVPESAFLRELAAKCECSLNNVVQAAWSIVLARYHGHRESVFGTTRACRHSALDGAANEMIGLLINTVPMRVHIPAGATVRSVLTSLKRLQKVLRDHENTPLTDIYAAAGLAPDQQLFSNYLMFEDLGADLSEKFPGWSYELHEQTEQQLSSAATASSNIALALEYNRARYSDSAITRLLRDLRTVLVEMAVDADREVDSIPGFTVSILTKPIVACTRFANVVEAVNHWTQLTPESSAVASPAGVLTYAELEHKSNQLANHLIATGIRPGSTVGVSMDRSESLIVALIGIWKAGAAYVPVDPHYPLERRNYIVEDSAVTTVLCDLPDISGQPETAPHIQFTSESVAYIIYTSGSTGRPKGVLISHGSLANLCSAISRELAMTPADRMLQASSISFDISVEEVFATLWAGATIVPASSAVMSSVRDFSAFVRSMNCTLLDLPTAFWHELVAGISESGQSLPESVRLVAVGGERVLPTVYAAWRALPEGSRIRWLNAYGPTETTVTTTVYEPGLSIIGGNLPIGTPIEGVSVYVLDEQLRPMPLEASGELYIGGAGVGLGYLNAPNLTAVKFVPDPFAPGANMYRTGDNARVLNDGNIEFLGRRDFQVKFRGYRIELGEIEATAESHPQVLQAIAQVRNSTALILFVVPRAGVLFTPGSVGKWLSERVADWMLPTAIVALDELPITPNGKVDRVALAGVPVEAARPSHASEPVTDLERQLVNLWESLFQKSPISPEDNFFGLGGHSLLAMRMLVQAEKLVSRKLTFADLSRAPTIRQFARAISGRADQRLPECLVVLQQSGHNAPLFCFHGAGGVVHWYNDLALRITDRPVIGIQVAESPDLVLPTSIDQMCIEYIKAIRQVQPHGPYHFFGHSMGGILAYHCSVLCAQQGEPIGFTGTLDGWNRSADNPHPSIKVARLIRYFWSLNGKKKAEFLKEKLHWLRIERAQNGARAMEGIDTNQRNAIKAHNVRLAREYVPPAYGGEIHVFRANKRSATEDPDPMLGWGGVARHVITHSVPGNHFTLLTPPNVKVLAKKLKRVFRTEAT
jgi:amino acid adenylation domain-containing protein